MSPTDGAFPETRSQARPDAPWDLDAPWVIEPPSRLTFLSDEKPALRSLLRALGRRVRALIRVGR